MANMLRGKFRDKIRNYFKNRNNKYDNDINKETIRDINGGNLNNKNAIIVTQKNKQTNERNNILNNIPKITNRQNRQYFWNISNKKKKKGNSKKTISEKINSNDRNNVQIEILELMIINKINDTLILYKNKLELLQSDIYVLNQLLEDKKDKQKCEEEKKEIEQIISKLKKIKEQYEILKSKNISMDYLGLTEGNLVDDIYKYKKLLDNDLSVDKLQDEYKKIDLFLEINLIIDDVQDTIAKLENANKEKLEKIGIAEKDFEEMKMKTDNFDKDNLEYEKFINSSNNILKELSSKISVIDSKEEINYKLSGIDGLLFNNIKYISLLMLSPLKGLFPSLATSIIATKQTLDTIKGNIKLEKNTKIVYMTKDYSIFIKQNMYTVENMKGLVSESLDDVKRIKEELKTRCLHLDSLQYLEVLKKLDVVENNLKENEKKLNIIDNKLNEMKKINDKKLKKIKVLND